MRSFFGSSFKSKRTNANIVASLSYLKACNNVTETARRFKVSRKTIYNWIKLADADAKLQQAINNAASSLKQEAEAEVYTTSRLINEAQSGALLSDLVKSLCILIDKYEALKGE